MTTAPLFGLLILDRDPLVYANLPGLVQSWLQDAGGFAALGLALYILNSLFGGRAVAAGSAAGVGRGEATEADRVRNPVSGFMLTMAVLAVLTYSAFGFLWFTGRGVDPVQPKPYSALGYFKPDPPRFSTAPQPLVLMTAGLFAILGIGQPFAAGLLRVRFRRVWALTRVSFKEAVRNKLFWVFLLFLIPFLFPAKWFLPGKPEDELRSTIGFSSFVSTFLLLFPAALLAAFSIPNDIKNQNIYTIVTKPVERFEIVLGRFLGYVYLMTLALFGMTLVGWVFIASTTIDEKAQQETYLARMPVRGTLSFESRKGLGEGTNVGREFDYRKYIGGHEKTSQRAVYHFRSVPGGLARGRTRDAVPMEFTFDIFRMTKGQENRGVFVDVQVATANSPLVPPPVGTTDPEWRWADPARKIAYTKAAVAKLGLGNDPIVKDWERNNNWDEIYNQRVRPRTRGVGPDDRDWPVVNELAGEFGFYEIAGKEVYDYHPDQIFVPARLFENAATAKPTADGPAPVTVYVKCTTPGQMLGMAEGDLYFLETDPSPSARLFAQNYFKSAVGLWCRVCIVVGLAVTCSTYLAGVISFLVAGFLFLAGYFSDHLADMASGKSFVGGPLQSLSMLLEAKPPTSQMEESNPLTKVALSGDAVVSWMFRRLINVVPDLDAFSWTAFVSEGFNVPVEYLVMNVVVLTGYLLPWFVLGFYLMRSREVAA